MHTDDPVVDLVDRFTAALKSHGLDEGDERHQPRELVIVVSA